MGDWSLWLLQYNKQSSLWESKDKRIRAAKAKCLNVWAIHPKPANFYLKLSFLGRIKSNVRTFTFFSFCSWAIEPNKRITPTINWLKSLGRRIPTLKQWSRISSNSYSQSKRAKTGP